MRQLRVADVVLSFTTTAAQLGYAKLDPATRDLDGARLAIDALRALMPVLEGAAEGDTVRDLRQVVTNLQLAYAAAAAEPREEARSPQQQPEPEHEPEQQPEAEAERGTPAQEAPEAEREPREAVQEEPEPEPQQEPGGSG